MKEQDTANSFAGEKRLACKKAIRCLYIAVEEPIASDVDNKVSAFVHQLETEITRLRSELQQERELRKELVEAVEKLLRVDSFRGGFPYTTKVFESVIQKSKAK